MQNCVVPTYSVGHAQVNYPLTMNGFEVGKKYTGAFSIANKERLIDCLLIPCALPPGHDCSSMFPCHAYGPYTLGRFESHAAKSLVHHGWLPFIEQLLCAKP